jgi:hypothetical protein
MKVMVFDVPDAVITRLLEAVQAPVETVQAPAEKPPTQGVVAGLGEQSAVMSPKAPPMGVLRMTKLATHPWFQEWAAFMAPAPLVAECAGDSLKVAQRLLGSLVLKGKQLQEWGQQQDELLADVEKAYRDWVSAKGRNLAEA